MYARGLIYSAVVAFCLLALPLPSLGSDRGTCTRDSKGKHLFFSVGEGRTLLGKISKGEAAQAQIAIRKQQVQLAEEKAALWRLQMESAEKALAKTVKALATARKAEAACREREGRYQQEIAKLRENRIWWLLGGVGAAILLVGGAVAVGLVVGR